MLLAVKGIQYLESHKQDTHNWATNSNTTSVGIQAVLEHKHQKGLFTYSQVLSSYTNTSSPSPTSLCGALTFSCFVLNALPRNLLQYSAGVKLKARTSVWVPGPENTHSNKKRHLSPPLIFTPPSCPLRGTVFVYLYPLVTFTTGAREEKVQQCRINSHSSTPALC